MKGRRPIVAALAAGALLTLLLVIALVLWFVLTAVGDVSGATVARVLSLLIGICWCIDLIILVVLLALAQIGSCEDHAQRGEHE